MICFDTDKGRFNLRSVAVIIQDEHVLIHRAVKYDFWALPGGRVELFETSNKTVVRELVEELGYESEVIRPLWHVENFFEYDSKRFHELSNYFLTSLITPISIKSETDFEGIETSIDLLFRWVPLDILESYNLKPDFLLKKLVELPDSLEYVTIDDIN